MNEEEIVEKIKFKIGKIKQNYSDDYLFSYYWTKDDVKNVEKLLDLYNQEKEKNKKLEDVINNLAKGVRFLGTNEELATEDIIKMFSPEEIKIDFDDFMNRWENEQHKKADLKDKVIDMIAVDYMNNHINDEYSDTPCEYYEEIEKKEKCQGKMWDDVCFGDCKECLIQYYFKKARGEENETN